MKVIYTALACILLSSCASILSKSTYPLAISTDPSGAEILIKDGKGNTIFEDRSPATVNLKASQGFFKKAQYSVTISQSGFQSKTVPVNFKVDGWYWGNLLLGGVVGMLIVDPATGAMYKIENESMTIRLNESNTGDAFASNTPSLEILTIDKLPKNYRGSLVKVDQLDQE